MNLLSRDCKTPIKRLQDSYQQIVRLLSRDYKTPINLLSRDLYEPYRRLQDSYKTPINLLLISYQEIITKHNKMLEYLNFCLLCTLFALILCLCIRAKKYLSLLKMAEEICSSFDAQSDTKCQKLLECILTGNSKLFLGKVYTEDQLAKLNEKEVEKLFNNYEAKISGQMVKSLGHPVINTYSMEE